MAALSWLGIGRVTCLYTAALCKVGVDQGTAGHNWGRGAKPPHAQGLDFNLIGAVYSSNNCFRHGL